jgi:preprotein translocase subunit SecA
MAGRGTDITVSEDVIKLGGLHVIALYRNDARRIDRQLYGRCARQGDPGSVEVIISFDDPLLVNYYSSTLIKLLVSLTPKNKPLFSFVSRLVLRLPQRMKERQQAQLRGAMMTQDLKRRRILAFSGKFD